MLKRYVKQNITVSYYFAVCWLLLQHFRPFFAAFFENGVYFKYSELVLRTSMESFFNGFTPKFVINCDSPLSEFFFLLENEPGFSYVAYISLNSSLSTIRHSTVPTPSRGCHTCTLLSVHSILLFYIDDG